MEIVLNSFVLISETDRCDEYGTAAPCNNNKPSRPSLAKIVLSMDTDHEKQQALGHILAALPIIYAR